jgi:uncharacterized membrane protein (UPF0127 family)
MVRFNFKLRGKNFSTDVKECRNLFQKTSGLMFRKKSKALLFIFNKKISLSIHSLFCVPFIGIWFDGRRIIEARYVSPWRFYVKPFRKFDKLLEIPCNDKNFREIKSLLKN